MRFLRRHALVSAAAKIKTVPAELAVPVGAAIDDGPDGLHTAFSAFVVGVCWSSMLCCSVQAWAHVAGVVQLLCVPFSAQSTKSGLASDRIKLS
jgi:hypothetical protein